MTERWLKFAEIRERLGAGKTFTWMAMKQMPRLKVGKLVRVRESDFDAWVQKHTVVVDDEVPA